MIRMIRYIVDWKISIFRIVDPTYVAQTVSIAIQHTQSYDYIKCSMYIV